MMRMILKNALVLGSILGLAACGNISNQDIGTAAGAAAGGLIGNQFGGGSGKTVATVIGALAGGVIGNNIGRQLDARSREAALNAEYNALERGRPGVPVNWQGNNGVYGQVVPQQSYQVGSRNCRRYTHTIYVDGRPEQASGTACRQADGTWRPLN